MITAVGLELGVLLDSRGISESLGRRYQLKSRKSEFGVRVTLISLELRQGK
jgi:hypothetical protein